MPIPRPYMPDAKSVAQVMQQNLQKVGVSAKLVTYEWATYLTKTGERGAFDVPARVDRGQRRP